MEDNDKTRLIRRTSAESPQPPGSERSLDKSRNVAQPAPVRPPSPLHTQAEEDKTVILSPPARPALPAGAVAPQNDPMKDPVVGWLVIISGPGQGNCVQLGRGMNSIGRGEGQRCRFDFGDAEISRNNHATVTYDARGRKFYLMHGGGQNLTYLGESPVLQPVLLNGGEVFSIGKTSVKFIPLCGPDFDWA